MSLSRENKIWDVDDRYVMTLSERCTEEIRRKLRKLQCPFTWKLPMCSRKDIVSHIEKKLARLENENDDFTMWSKFVFTMMLCNEYAKRGKRDASIKKFEECMKVCTSCDSYLPVSVACLNHVSLATKIFLLLKSEAHEEIYSVLSDLVPVENLHDTDKAGILGIKGIMFMEYGIEAVKLGILFLENAVKLDSMCAQWHFLLGKACMKVRRCEDHRGIPLNREVKALDTAVKIDRNAMHMVLLAEAYTELSRASHFNGFPRLSKSRNRRFLQKASGLWRESLRMSPDNPYILGRCAYGFMRLPYPWKDMSQAADCIFRGLEKDPDNHLVQMTLVEYLRKADTKYIDVVKADSLRLAETGLFGACLMYLSVKWKENELYDLTSDIKKFLNDFSENGHQQHLSAVLGAYRYFNDGDFEGALKVWYKIREEDANAKVLNFIEYQFHHEIMPLCINKIILHGIINGLNNTNCHAKEKKRYEEILNEYTITHPNLVRSEQSVVAEQERARNECVSLVARLFNNTDFRDI